MSPVRSVTYVSGPDPRSMEARVGFEPTNGGFADLSLGPLGYRAEPLSIANLLDLSGHLRATLLRRRLLFLRDRGNFCFAQEPRRFFRRCWIDVKARAPFKAGHFGQLRNDLDMPVIVIVDFFTDRRRVNHEIEGGPVQQLVQS